MPDITFGLLRGAVGDEGALMTQSIMSVQQSGNKFSPRLFQRINNKSLM